MPYAFPMQRSREIAAIYAAAPTVDPAALPAFHAFAQEVDRQYAALPVRVEVVPFNPYATHHELFADIDAGRLQILATGATDGDAGHPVIDARANDRFRAVHDYFGHYRAGVGFDRHGEYAAWLRHSATFESDAARAAMTTETRAQNSAQIVTGGFVAQKAFLLPSEYLLQTF